MPDRDGRHATPAKLPYFVHESSYVDDGCDIGEKISIWHFSICYQIGALAPNARLARTWSSDRASR